MATAAADAESVEHVNSYCKSQVNGSLRCALDGHKGRVLLAVRDFECGDRLFSEAPLHLVAEAPADPGFTRLRRLAKQRGFAHTPLWYWAALGSLTEADCRNCEVVLHKVSVEQQQRLQMLFHPAADSPSKDILAIVQEFWAQAPTSQRGSVAAKLERLLGVWLLNCFEHSEEPVGFSTFFLPSFVSHDCRPNCMWHYEGDSFVMRARKAIAAGDEITVSYLAEEALLESTASRRTQLEATKHFLCNCGTCSATLDLVRGFACPGCKEGEVFLDVRGERPASAAQGACRRCGFLPDARQVSDLAEQEARIEELVQEWDRRMGKTGTGPENLLTDAIVSSLHGIGSEIGPRSTSWPTTKPRGMLRRPCLWPRAALRLPRKSMDSARSMPGLWRLRGICSSSCWASDW
ncbi:unnamed protein product [Polarella glacialis]|uniref:SET domain-containing protein n=1 Tax=Polarella glacialis TaxID=89957 RepID=A0A813F7N2_POLGL|nr:unnamed protein product [Polarella glacialis]